MKRSLSDKPVQTFLNLLSACIHDTSVPAPALRDEEWKAVVALAKAHNVLPLVFEKASECDNFLCWREYPQTAALAMTIAAEQAQRTEAFLNIYQQFLQKGLHPVVMKGILCRQLYGEYGDHRPSGDEDLLIVKTEYLAVQAVLAENGYLSEIKISTEAQLEGLEEISFHNPGTHLSVDVHWALMGKENKLRARMNHCFENVFLDCHEELVSGIPIMSMSHTNHLLFLVLHAFKHFTIGGFGIRQVLDILLYAEKYESECNWDDLKDILHEVKADVFLNDLFCIGNRYLGFQRNLWNKPNCPDELLEEILGCGAFGNTTQIQNTAAQMTNAKLCGENGEKTSEFKGFLYSIFPDKANMIAPYPVLREKPWLLPVCWVRRWMRFLRNNGLNSGRQVAEGLRASRRRVALLKKYKIL